MKQAHHIVPDYRCKELGITTSYKVRVSGKLVEFYFKENYLPDIEQIEHALIHWGYFHNDLEPLYKYVRPEQWVIDLIPIGDARDYGAAVLNARGGIDGIDMSGKNSPAYKHGNTIGKYTLTIEEWNEQWNEYQNEWREKTGYKKKWDKDNWQREAERKRKSWRTWPSVIKKREESIRKKAERQGEGTLDKFLK